MTMGVIFDCSEPGKSSHAKRFGVQIVSYSLI